MTLTIGDLRKLVNDPNLPEDMQVRLQVWGHSSREDLYVALKQYDFGTQRTVFDISADCTDRNYPNNPVTREFLFGFSEGTIRENLKSRPAEHEVAHYKRVLSR